MAHITVLSLVLLSCIINTVISNDTSELDCETLLPKGKTASITGPYKLTLSSEAVTQGEDIEVTLSGDSEFKRFMVQGRRAVLQTPAGKFQTSEQKYLRTCSAEHDTVSSNDFKSTKSLSFKWTTSKTGVFIFVASIIDADGKAYIAQAGPVTVKSPPAVTPTVQDEEDEESQRRPDEEEEKPAKPAETNPPKNDEDPNAAEKEMERQRQESLRRDQAGAAAEEEKKAETTAQQTEGEGEGEGESRRLADEEEEGEGNSRKREEEAEEEGEMSRRERIEYEIRKGEEEDALRTRIHMETLKMEEQEAEEEEERLKRIRWEEEDWKRHQKKLEQDAADKIKTDTDKTADKSDEISVKDNFLVHDGSKKVESGAGCLVSSVAMFLSIVAAVFIL